ncbi:hypothetical protein QE152_g9321 [Popillia japonica]|uniref:DUF8207 domain-containing protein n=1 Tax=Popillia japonica TaxID=7064 RepID=A0AAW1LV34_POPJA
MKSSISSNVKERKMNEPTVSNPVVERNIDIHYAPIVEPLKEIVRKLDKPGRETKQSLSDIEFEETFSSFLPEKSYGVIPGTSIIKRGHTLQSHKRVSWFSPGVHSSPTNAKKSKARDLPKISETPRQAQPSFLEDEYIGEYLPETSIPPKDDEEEILGEFEDDRKQDVVKESLKGHHHVVRPYLIGLMIDEKEEFDEKYGIREAEGKLKIGNADVRFEDDKIVIGEFRYNGTKGLYELLFKKNPGKFTYADAKNYKYILKNTHSYKVDYNPNKKNAASRGTKYMKFIKPILEGHPPNVWWTRNWKTGLGLGNKNKMSRKLSKKLYPNSVIEYKYWNDVKELCDRLKLLIASKEAGHTGHDNEIIAITEELKEANVI